MSGRINRDITSTRSSQLTQQQPAYINEVLKDAGIILSYSDKLNALTKEQSLVVRDMEKKLQSHISYPDNVQEFLAGLKQLCKRDENFQKALLPCQLRKTDDLSVENGAENAMKQDSLFRLILNVNCLQKPCIDILFDKLMMHATEESEEDIGWVLQILNALKYLPYIQESGDLSRKLLDALEIATYLPQLEILNSIPEIIPDGQYDDIAKELTKFLDDNLNLQNTVAGAVVNCLNLMTISKEVRSNIQDCVLSKLFCEEYFSIFPLVYEFLVTEANSQSLPGLLLKVRNVIDAIMGSPNTDNERQTTKLVLLNKLKFSAASSKMIYDAWLGLISSIRTSSDHKPVDLLLLFMLYMTANMRRKNVEMLIKKKVKNGVFKIPLLEEFASKCLTQQIVKDYLNAFTNIACYLLQNSGQNAVITDFALELYKLLYRNENTDYMQHQEIIYSLLLQTNERSGVVLKTLLELAQEDPEKLRKHTRLLMSLLEKVDNFELRDAQLVFDVLCTLTIPEESNTSGLKDEIHMLVRKQLSSCLKPVKHRGIVAAVVMAKHLAAVDYDQSDITIDTEASITLGDLPDNASREAAGLLELVNISTSGCADSLGLYYDQLATMLITAKFLDKHFIAWLLETMTNNFESTYVTDVASEQINDLDLSAKYSLNSDSEVEVPISVNIGGLSMKNDQNIVILAPIFRLLRLLHYRHNNGDLSTIDALLGCGVIMPDTELITSMDSDQIAQTADCIFHCVNWFREIVNGFITQRSKQLRRKLVQRLEHLIELEEHLNKCMEIVPDHKLPSSRFDSLVSCKQSPVKADNKGVKRSKKMPKSTETVNVDDSVTSTAATTQTVKTKTSSTSISSTESKNYSFRDMDTDIIVLLKYPVKITKISQRSQTDTQGNEALNLKQFCFLLNDIVVKLEHLIKRTHLSSFLNLINVHDIITDLKIFLPNISSCFHNLTKKINEILQETDGHRDHPDLFTSEANEIKYGHGLILYFYSLLFSWPDFQHSKNLSLLKEFLRAVRGEDLSQLNSANRQILDYAGRLFSSLDTCIHITAAVSLVKTLQALHEINVNPDLKKIIVTTSGKLLKKKWYTIQGKVDGGKTYNANITILLKAYLDGANVKTICGLVGTLQRQAPDLKSKNDSLPMLASIDKTSFHILFRGLCNALQERIATEIEGLTNDEHLVLWRTTALTLQGLMSIVKVQETKPNLVCYLKGSLKVLKIFLNQGVPILEIMLRSKPDEVVEILKTTQTSTRFLHHLCCHAKLNKDTALMAYVPQFRLTLETLVYRVKAALVANNCSDAFWMGNLRNRNLHGEDILSQSTVSTENSGDKSEEEMEEDDSDEEMEVEESIAGSASVSDIV